LGAGPEGFEPAYRGWTTKDRTVTGHIRHPQAGTAEKGEYLFATYTAGVIKLLETSSPRTARAGRRRRRGGIDVLIE
jgi:creatinine amidohydrolase/Fe(II)-dependent formamide hydrolase-like protein